MRKQWPRKGRLEVEIYQERKAQVSAHNKKYERQVRTCLEKYNTLEDDWANLLDKVQDEFKNFEAGITKLQTLLPSGKNLA